MGVGGGGRGSVFIGVRLLGKAGKLKQQVCSIYYSMLMIYNNEPTIIVTQRLCIHSE